MHRKVDDEDEDDDEDEWVATVTPRYFVPSTLASHPAIAHNHFMSSGNASTRRGYPLVALFMVITACCVVAALVGPAMRGVFEGKIVAGDAVTATLVCGAIVMALGGIVGSFHYHRGKGFALGLLTGAIIGGLVGPIILVPAAALGTMLGLSAGGAVVILLVAVAFRFASRKD